MREARRPFAVERTRTPCQLTKLTREGDDTCQLGRCQAPSPPSDTPSAPCRRRSLSTRTLVAGTLRSGRTYDELVGWLTSQLSDAKAQGPE